MYYEHSEREGIITPLYLTLSGLNINTTKVSQAFNLEIMWKFEIFLSQDIGDERKLKFTIPNDQKKFRIIDWKFSIDKKGFFSFLINPHRFMWIFDPQ